MMEWERPIMERSAEIVCHNHGDVLNVGFGMAIIDTAIQKQGITTHTIIEAHPQVIEKAFLLGTQKRLHAVSRVGG
jgi:protein arginine N-methyltransferase 2